MANDDQRNPDTTLEGAQPTRELGGERDAATAPQAGPADATDGAAVGSPAPDAGERDDTTGQRAGVGQRAASGQRDGACPDATCRRDAVADATRPAACDEPVRLRDVGGTLGSYLRGRWQAARELAGRHRAATAAIALLCVAMACLLALAFARANNVPGRDYVTDDALARVQAPAYSPGLYGPDDVLVARGVEVRSQARRPTAIDSSAARFGASAYAEADVLVTYEGRSVRAEKNARLGYARVDRAWEPIGEEVDAQVAWTALAGVDRARVVANVGDLLDLAERDLRPDPGATTLSLREVYAGAQVEVTEESFDEQAQTDRLVLRLAKASPYEAYVCDLEVSFSFRPASGQWEVAGATASSGSKTRVFDPLLGTWAGTFQSQDSAGRKCLAAQGQGLSVTIESGTTDDAGSRIEGRVSGVAHFHEPPQRDQPGCDGDLAFEDVPFTATLVGGHDDETGSDLTFVSTLPDQVGGTVTLKLGFGSAEDPDRVTALVRTTYPHTGSVLFIPVERTVTCTDRFTLERQ